MINIKIFRNKDNIIGFKIKGHANFAEYGEDIVCAAISVLSQTSLMALVEVCGIEESKLHYSIDDKTGFLEVNLPKNIDIESLEKSQIVLKTFELGVKSIIESYPNNVALNNREV
ncbi:MAG: ribosomal-processing cysteine protease Prp [Tissierellaceae bacterium]|nr:ribosomal-processing cysteine protease Prp [Tissierellaceae bacterium]